LESPQDDRIKGNVMGPPEENLHLYLQNTLRERLQSNANNPSLKEQETSQCKYLTIPSQI
jgi:hypothetical protein